MLVFILVLVLMIVLKLMNMLELALPFIYMSIFMPELKLVLAVVFVLKRLRLCPCGLAGKIK